MFQPVLLKEEGGDGVFMSSVHSPGLRMTGHIDHQAKRACSGLRVIRAGIVQGKAGGKKRRKADAKEKTPHWRAGSAQTPAADGYQKRVFLSLWPNRLQHNVGE